MPVRLPLRAKAAVLVLVGLLAGCGGGNDQAPSSAPTPATPGGVVVGAPQANSAVCDGVDLAVFKSRVYVSEGGSDSAGCGQQTDRACRTIPQGIARCAANGANCSVVVRHGLYPAAKTLSLVDGVGIQASCRFDGEADRRYRSVMQMATGVTQGISAINITSATVVRGLVVVGGESPPSNANIGVYAEASPGLTMEQTLVIAGKGGDGADPGAAQADAGESGSPGNNHSLDSGAAGGRACASNPPAPVAYGRGGQGGDGMNGGANVCGPGECSCFINNPDGVGGRSGAGTARGPSSGGQGGDNGAKPGEGCLFAATGSDFYGRRGGNGSEGSCAAKGGTRVTDVWGPFAAGVWSPTSGGTGALGDVGSGGGGGSSGGFCVQLKTGFFSSTVVDYFVHGVPGGGGGGGGCGGQQGAGGVQGGPSIALMVKGMPATRLVTGNGWIAAPGGRGGSGAAGGAGGAGGGGGAGGAGLFSRVQFSGGPVACPAPGGMGGTGGPGGAGSGGAGGNGGPSITVALTSGAVMPASHDGLYLGPPGIGGAAGPGGAGSHCSGGTGEAGIGGAAGTIVNVDALPQNVLAAGDALEPGQVRTSPNGIYTLKMQADTNLCFYRNGSYQWCSQQSLQASGVRLAMGIDGNLCLRDASNGSNWCSNSTVGHTGAYLVVQDDGTVRIVDGSDSLRTLP